MSEVFILYLIQLIIACVGVYFIGENSNYWIALGVTFLMWSNNIKPRGRLKMNESVEQLQKITGWYQDLTTGKITDKPGKNTETLKLFTRSKASYAALNRRKAKKVDVKGDKY